jgi:Family of unknown function (DUF5681)
MVEEDKKQSLAERGKATRFQPGRSGNPTGRPPIKALTNALERVLAQPVDNDLLVGRLSRYKGTGITFGEVISLQQVYIASFPGKKGKAQATAAFREIIERLEGKVPLQVKSEHTHTHIELTDEERRARILAIASKASNVIDVEFTDVPALPERTDEQNE